MKDEAPSGSESRMMGLDIGGANLKAATTDGAALHQPFALWKTPDLLEKQLRDLLHSLPTCQALAVTMTGELCDCFATKRAGVEHIVRAVVEAAGGSPVRFWSTAGCFVDSKEAIEHPLEVAAANWHALATFVGRFAPLGASVLFDVGTTTSDIIPLYNGKPIARGQTDPQRIKESELVYTGVRRTPLCSLFGPDLASELFATTEDVYLLLSDLPEDPANTATADGRPATQAHAHARIARMRCDDVEGCSLPEAVTLARDAQELQIDTLLHAFIRVANGLPDQPSSIIIAGSGEFLIHRVIGKSEFSQVPRVSLGEMLGPTVSEAACAYAVAQLARELP